MNWKVIKTEAEHKRAVKRAMKIFHAEPGTPEDDELGVLRLLIKNDDDKTVKMRKVALLEVNEEKIRDRN